WKMEIKAIEWVFTHVWDGIKAVAGGLGDFFAKAFQAVSATVKGLLNDVIGAINTVIDAIDSIHFSLHLPGFMGGAGFDFKGFGIPHVPTFADGGMVGGPSGAPTLALVHGGEAVFNPAQLRALGRGGGQVQEHHHYYTFDLHGAYISDQASLDRVADGIHSALLRKQSRGHDLQIRDTRLGAGRR
nr:hypothetical protein [Actinomycetota bacterium]